MGELLGFDSSLLHESEPVVGQRSVFLGEDDVAAVFDLLCAAASDDRGNVFEFVPAAEVGAVADNAVVEDAAAVAVFRFFQAVDEMREERGTLLVAFAGGEDAGLGKSVVAQ